MAGQTNVAHVDLRTVEEVKKVLTYAKIQPSEFKPFVQCINFSESLENENLKLLEIDASIMDSLVEGQQVVIRGDKADGAVLCTEEKTYELKEAETSNSLLILPDCVTDNLTSDGELTINHLQVISSLKTYYEMKPCKAKLEKLRHVLEENIYSGQECEDDEAHQGKKYTTEDLLDIVQASEKELFAGLKKLNICFINGYWRMLDFDFKSQVLSHVLQLSEEEDGWMDSGVPLDACCQILEELYLRCVIEHVLKCYTDEVDGATGKLYKLSEDKVCAFFAELTLRNAGKFNLAEFLEVWKQCVPEGMTTNLRQTEGIALVSRESKPEVIWYFSAEDLPEDLAERFSILFQAQGKWTLDEITPYLKDLETGKLDVSSMLLKYARASTQNAQKIYTSRKPVI
ncbi:sister chromatid cohesion protein DCC1-like [Octopus sinensis]|uniref:Sister chromatid cohesion protein DCC1 n=1 Tax=Octopus sinensis TaxID=2607531 RepID=A0A6P7SSI2_9MOLL|nr:sister chromatid cohesion protein DCC1-like [Octopus sinensis]